MALPSCRSIAYAVGMTEPCATRRGLTADSPWSLVRQQWRRSSLRWHPDHGGDPATWLRKQRADEALKGAASPSRRVQPGEGEAKEIQGKRIGGHWMNGKPQHGPWRRS